MTRAHASPREAEPAGHVGEVGELAGLERAAQGGREGALAGDARADSPRNLDGRASLLQTAWHSDPFPDEGAEPRRRTVTSALGAIVPMALAARAGGMNN